MSNTVPSKISLRSILRENAALVAMYVLGVIIASLLWGPLGLIYLGYALFSNLLYMARVCAYCEHYRTATCHAGYHLLSGGRFRGKKGRDFAGQFKRNVIMLYPGWFVPPIVGLYMLYESFSWVVAVIIAGFLLVGFVILPRDSARYCEVCKNEKCPRRRIVADELSR
jgi:hypothetical protein